MTSPPQNTTQSLQPTLHDLITASHILHHHSILDAYGHISIRHPFDPSLFILPRNLAPALLSSPSDLVQYHISDASPVDHDAPRGYSERHIHSAIYKAHPHIYSVLHSHSDLVIPYSITKTHPLKPVYHMAGFLDQRGTPIFDIAEYFQDSDIRDMLVRNQHLGDALAGYFNDGNNVSLMRGHGFTAVGKDIKTTVFKGIYTAKNAGIQSASLALAGGVGGEGVKYLSEEEARDSTGMGIQTVDRPWELWVREVERSGLYDNFA